MVSISQLTKIDNPPKYFALDIDNTFHAHNKEALRKNVEEFNKMMKLGYIPLFCTGRSLYSSMFHLGEDFTKNSSYKGYPGIYFNGSLIYDENGSIIYTREFSERILIGFIEFLKLENKLDKCAFYSATSWYSLVDVVNDFLVKSNTEKAPIPNIITVEELCKQKIIYVLVSETNVVFHNLIHGEDYIAKNTFDGFSSITPCGITKANGIRIFMDHLGLPHGYCGFIGDGENDIEAMQLSNLSFAVGNASDEVKKEAKYCVDLTNEEAAFAYAVKRVYNT